MSAETPAKRGTDYQENKSVPISFLKGAAKGAIAGALITGPILPVVGPIIGAKVGAVYGAFTNMGKNGEQSQQQVKQVEASNDVIETLKKLNELKNDGIITEEEFQQKKSQLLKKL